MPVAGDIKLTMTAEMQDAAAAKLRMIQGELGKTAQAVREAKSATADDHEVEQILIRAKDRRLKLAADERRESVLAARATRDAAEAKGKLASGFESVSEKARAFHETQLRLNEILGVAGFVGAIGAAVVGLVKLVESMSSYGRAMAEVKAQQADLNKLTQQFEDAGFAELVDQMKQGWIDGDARLLVASKHLDEWRDKAVDIQHKLDALENAKAQNEARSARAAADADNARRRGTIAELQNLTEQRRLEVEHRGLVGDIERQKHAVQAAQGLINRLLREATPEYWQHADAAAKLAEESRKIAEAAHMAIDAGKKASDDAHEKQKAAAAAGASAAKATADRVRGLERELELAQKHGDVARLDLQIEHIRDDLAAKRLTKREAEAMLALKQFEVESKIREHQEAEAKQILEKRKDEKDRALSLQEQLALLNAGNESAKAKLQLEQELARIEREKRSGTLSGGLAGLESSLAQGRFKKEQEARDREAAAKQVEKIGGAAEKTAAKIAMLSGRMSGLAPAIAAGTQLWEEYQKGTIGVGQAVAGTVGVLGEAAAQGISDDKARALVRGGYEQFEAIASFAALQFAQGAEHEAASIGFFALAGQGGGGSGSRGGGGSSAPSAAAAPSQQTGRSQQDTRPVVQVIYGKGVVYGMGSEVAKANASTGESLRGTGMGRRRY